MGSVKVLYVFRKQHPGNHSIENVYTKISAGLLSSTDWRISRLELKATYDFITFLKCFIQSLFSTTNIVHVTGGCSYMVLAFPFQNRFLTIHDIIRFKQLKGLKKWLYKKVYIAWPCKLSHKIVVVSKQTEKELLALYPNLSKKISVIHNPLLVEQQPAKTNPISPAIANIPTILQMGDKATKNFEFLIEATHTMELHYLFLHAYPKHLKALLEKYNLRHRSEIYTRLDISEMSELYRSASILYFASLEEGFGLPIIEAQCLGIPVITSNRPPMNAIGKGAIMIDPQNEQELRDAISALQNSAIRAKVIQNGYTNAKRFLPAKIAEEYRKLYAEVL